MLSKLPSNNKGGNPLNYVLIDVGEDQLSIIKITEGPFRGVRFRIGKVSFDEGLISFTADVVRKPLRLYFKDLENNDLFTTTTGNILLSLMERNCSEYKNTLVG